MQIHWIVHMPCRKQHLMNFIALCEHCCLGIHKWSCFLCLGTINAHRERWISTECWKSYVAVHGAEIYCGRSKVLAGRGKDVMAYFSHRQTYICQSNCGKLFILFCHNIVTAPFQMYHINGPWNRESLWTCNMLDAWHLWLVNICLFWASNKNICLKIGRNVVKNRDDWRCKRGCATECICQSPVRAIYRNNEIHLCTQALLATGVLVYVCMCVSTLRASYKIYLRLQNRLYASSVT